MFYVVIDVLFNILCRLIFAQEPPSKNRKQKCNCILCASYKWLPVDYHLMSLLFKALRLWELSSLASGIPAPWLHHLLLRVRIRG